MEDLWFDASKCVLFENFGKDELSAFMSRPSVISRRFPKDSVIIGVGEVCRNICIVGEGKAVGETVSDDGRADEMAFFSKGEVFGDIIAMSESGESPVTVKALSDAKIIFIPLTEIFTESRLAANLAKSISKKYFSLRFRLSCVSKPTLRGKIMEYLRYASNGKTGVVFSVPFSHFTLADYLSVDRSALTRELTKLRKEGIIDYYGKNYKINRMV